MKPELFESECWLPRPIDEVFRFFSDVRNLQAITPDWLDFRIVTPGPVEIRPGVLIDYRLKIHGISIGWQSEISVWEPPHRFVDEQRRGPYRLWVHEHRFAPERNGTLVNDRVKYAVPGGWIVDRLFVRRDVRRIFEFRQQKLTDLFGGAPPKP